MESHLRQTIPNFHVAITRTYEAACGILLAPFALIPLASTRSTPSRVLQSFPKLRDLLQIRLLRLRALSETRLVGPELLELGGKQRRLHTGVPTIQQEDVRDVVILDLEIKKLSSVCCEPLQT
jgi:hypothetical protein